MQTPWHPPFTHGGPLILTVEHAVLQLPQLLVSVCVSTHPLGHIMLLGGTHVIIMEQTPPVQVCPIGQAVAQLPQ
jgi:hypothetical protein